MDTNHLPTVTDATLFSSDRVNVIPFNRHFAEHERDASLKAKLTAPESLSGILNWCLEGLRLLRIEKLQPPAAVKAATRSYEEDTDRSGATVPAAMQRDSRSSKRRWKPPGSEPNENDPKAGNPTMESVVLSLAIP